MEKDVAIVAKYKVQAENHARANRIPIYKVVIIRSHLDVRGLEGKMKRVIVLDKSIIPTEVVESLLSEEVTKAKAVPEKVATRPATPEEAVAPEMVEASTEEIEKRAEELTEQNKSLEAPITMPKVEDAPEVEIKEKPKAKRKAPAKAKAPKAKTEPKATPAAKKPRKTAPKKKKESDE